MFNEFNLKRGQRAERKLLITVAEWNEDGEMMREILGTRTEDSSIEYNADITTMTDIRGINYTDVDATQPQQDFDPYLVLGGSPEKCSERTVSVHHLCHYGIYRQCSGWL